MRVSPSALPDVLVVDVDVFRDDRGFFLESYHRQRLAEAGIEIDFVQDNHSRSARGVLRGFHYQDMTAPMAKLVRCTVGAVLDVALDLRVGSPTFGQTEAIELSADNMRQLLVPVGFGHAFLTLSDVAEVQYKCSTYYAPAAEGAIAWNDPDVAFRWPVEAPSVSAKDGAALSLRQYLERPAFQYQG